MKIQNNSQSTYIKYTKEHFQPTTIFVNLGSRIGSKNNSVLSRIPSLNNRQHNNYYMKFKGKYVKDRKDYCIKNDYYN